MLIPPVRSSMNETAKSNGGFIDESLNGEFPSWVTSKDRRILESTVGDIKANVVVAKDGSGKFKTVATAVASVLLTLSLKTQVLCSRRANLAWLSYHQIFCRG